MDWTKIEGWLTPLEGVALASMVAGKEVLELGSHRGRSAVCMAGTAAKVTTVDRQGSETLRENLEAHGVAGRVEIVVGEIEDAGATFPDESFDAVYIDADHDFESVRRDVILARRVLRPGGLYIFHDGDKPDVHFAARAEGLRLFDSVDSLRWCPKEK